MRLSGTVCASLLIFSPTAMCVPQSIPAPPPTLQTLVPQETAKNAAETKQRLEDLACAPEALHRMWTEQEPRALPVQPLDKALIYVIRPTHFGALEQTKLAVDRKWMGINRANNYFYFSLDPGQHYFCSDSSSNRSVLKLAIVAGKTYYLQQTISAIRTDLRMLNEQEGKKGLAKCKPSGFEDKNSVPRP